LIGNRFPSEVLDPALQVRDVVWLDGNQLPSFPTGIAEKFDVITLPIVVIQPNL
jgi:hypothetical protein